MPELKQQQESISAGEGSNLRETGKVLNYQGRLISVEDVRNYLNHIIYILFFDFFLNFLVFVRLQTPTSSTDQLWFFVT